MKKFLFILFTSVAILGVSTGCSNDENDQYAKTKEELFTENLKELRNKQENILYSARTRAEGELSDEELEQMAIEIDSLTEIFLWENAEYLAETMPEWNLTEDEIAMLSLDQDSLMNFINTYFSPVFYNGVNVFINNNETRSTTTPPTTSSTSPLELVILSNLEVVSKMDNHEMQIDPSAKITCGYAYTIDMKNCKSDYITNTIIYGTAVAAVTASFLMAGGAFCGSIVPGVGTAAGGIQGGSLGFSGGMYVGRLLATQQLHKCTRNARKDYEKCKEGLK